MSSAYGGASAALENMYPGTAHSGRTRSEAPAAAASSRRARQAARFRSFSISLGSICPTATRTRPTLLPLRTRMARVRFYYDVVCPYSYLESHVLEAAEAAGSVEVDRLPVQLGRSLAAFLEPPG